MNPQKLRDGALPQSMWNNVFFFLDVGPMDQLSVKRMAPFPIFILNLLTTVKLKMVLRFLHRKYLVAATFIHNYTGSLYQ